MVIIMGYLQQLLIICPLVFLAGFVDAVAGGGGLISLPAYIFAGLPILNAAATNKFAMSLGTATSAIKFAKSGKITIVPALFTAGGAFVGSWCGTQIALHINENTLKLLLAVVLPLVAVFLIFKPNFGSDIEKIKVKTNARLYTYMALIGLALGLYDGLIGPGTGTFYILAFGGVIGYSMTTSSGNAKIGNLASNVASLLAYLISGKVLFLIALPAAAFTMLGNYVGSRAAIKNGSKIIKPIMVFVIVILFFKLIIDVFNLSLFGL